MTQFFFFGCWNRDNCGDKDYRKGLFDTLQPIAASFDFGVIAGDNVYAHNKKYYQSTLEYGFGLLENLREHVQRKKIYATIGNHDVYRKKVLEYQIQSPVITMPTNMYIRKDKTAPYLRIIFIDTNIFSHKKIPLYEKARSQIRGNIEDPEIENPLDMFIRKDAVVNPHEKTIPIDKKFFVVQTESDVIALLEQLKKEDKKTQYQGWTIVVGHEPIISIKPKVKNGVSYTKMNTWIPYLRTLELLASMPKTVYMCADVHSFQGWNVHTETGILPMVVVGTGGGEPDETLPIHTYSSGEYKMDLIASEYPYGYCEVKCTPTKLDIFYKPLRNCTVSNQTIHLSYENHQLRNKTSMKKTVAPGVCKAPMTQEALCILDPSKEMVGGKKKFDLNSKRKQ